MRAATSAPLAPLIARMAPLLHRHAATVDRARCRTDGRGQIPIHWLPSTPCRLGTRPHGPPGSWWWRWRVVRSGQRCATPPARAAPRPRVWRTGARRRVLSRRCRRADGSCSSRSTSPSSSSAARERRAPCRRCSRLERTASHNAALLLRWVAPAVLEDAEVIEAYVLLDRVGDLDPAEPRVGLHAERVVSAWDPRSTTWVERPSAR